MKILIGIILLMSFGLISCVPLPTVDRLTHVTIDNRTPYKFIVIINDQDAGELSPGGIKTIYVREHNPKVLQLRTWTVMGELWITSTEVTFDIDKIIITSFPSTSDDEFSLEFVRR